MDADITRSCDFFPIFKEKRPTFETLSDLYWSLYCISERFAYFIRTPKCFTDYNAQTSPFIYQTQFEKAEMLAKLDLDEFCEFGKNINITLENDAHRQKLKAKLEF